MKNMIKIFTVAMLASSFAFAQWKKPAKKATSQPATSAPATGYSYSSSYSSAVHEVTGLLGFAAGAMSFGVNYARMNDGFGYGGYFLSQGAKEKDNLPITTSFNSFGGLVKIQAIDTNMIKAYLAPGFGITLVKDGSLSATSGKKSDETILGPMFKMGVQYKANNDMSFGLERTQFANWFNDNLNYFAGPAEYYAMSGTFSF